VTILLFIVLLAVLILVHEAGHFFAARRFGMRVEEFGIGFPPRLWAKKKGETIWSINAIPLGGFVRIAGEDGESTPSAAGEVIEEETVAVAVARGDGEEEVVVEREQFFLTNQKSSGSFFSDKPIWQRTIVLCAGVFMNFVLGWLLFSIVFAFGVSSNFLIVSGVSEGSPAQTAGIVDGDFIQNFSDTQTFVDFVNEHRGQEITLSIEHEGVAQSISVTPRSQSPQGEGALGVGVIESGVERAPIGRAIWDGLVHTAQVFSFIFVMLFRLIVDIFGGGHLIQSVSGPVGIFQATGRFAGLGFMYFLNFAALISVNLAALNIFPFPALDGGRIMFLLIERIKGSAVSVKTQQIVNAAGFFLLIAFVIYVTVQDVGRLL